MSLHNTVPYEWIQQHKYPRFIYFLIMCVFMEGVGQQKLEVGIRSYGLELQAGVSLYMSAGYKD